MFVLQIWDLDWEWCHCHSYFLYLCCILMKMTLSQITPLNQFKCVLHLLYFFGWTCIININQIKNFTDQTYHYAIQLYLLSFRLFKLIKYILFWSDIVINAFSCTMTYNKQCILLHHSFQYYKPVNNSKMFFLSF